MPAAGRGIDWASEESMLCAVDAQSGRLATEPFAHDEAGIRALIGRMRKLGAGKVAIERPNGFDAFGLAEFVRTDNHRLRSLRPDSRLRAQLDAFWPGAARVFADVDSPIGLAFLGRYPAPAGARGLPERRMESFLARHAYCGRRTAAAAELLARLRGAPEGRAGALEAACVSRTGISRR